jgi:hypothetical protein
VPTTGAPRLVDDAAQLAKQLGNAVDLVENDELVRVRREEVARVAQLGAIGRGLEVEGSTMLATIGSVHTEELLIDAQWAFNAEFAPGLLSRRRTSWATSPG